MVSLNLGRQLHGQIAARSFTANLMLPLALLARTRLSAKRRTDAEAPELELRTLDHVS